MKKGLYLIILFIVWTILVKTVDVQFVEATNTFVGMGHLNQWFHHITGIHMDLYILTDWLGLVPVCVFLIFASLGLFQLIQRRNIQDYHIYIMFSDVSEEYFNSHYILRKKSKYIDMRKKS